MWSSRDASVGPVEMTSFLPEFTGKSLNQSICFWKNGGFFVSFRDRWNLAEAECK
jgi:hypothetical protein